MAEEYVVRYYYEDAKKAETVWEVRDALHHIRAKRRAAEIMIHVQGAWSGCPKAIVLSPGEDVPRRGTRLRKLLESPPFQRVIVVPIESVRKK